MHIAYFTERPYPYVPEDQIFRGGFFGTPNTYLDPRKGGALYNRYLDEKVYAEEVGFDGLMLNEHHGTPFCMGGVMDVEAAILARITKKARIILIGNPLPVVSPLRLAEELAEIDMISGGRLVSGFVRGAGSEQLFNNANPAYNREYFDEAHDFILKAWTTPGPWRYEGKHFHYRFVNPWALPIQKPHPPIWIPSSASPETAVWSAQRRYPLLALATFLDVTTEMWNLYADTAARVGYQAGPENFGYLQRVFVADSEEKAQELGKAHLYGGGIFSFARAEWLFPPGYMSRQALRVMARRLTDPAKDGGSLIVTSDADVQRLKQRIYDSYQSSQEQLQFIVGTPKTVLPKLRRVLEVLRPGVFGIWHHEGSPIMTHEDTLTCLRLLGQEVLPAMREIANELGIADPFQRQPGARPLPASGKREAVVGEGAAVVSA